MPKEETIELTKIKNAYIVKTGTTTGAPGANYAIQDSVNLTEVGAFWVGMTVVLLNGDNKGLARRINSVGQPNTISVYPPFPNNIVVGINYKILSNIAPSNQIQELIGLTDPTDPLFITLANSVDEQVVWQMGDGVIEGNYSYEFLMKFDMSNITKNTIIREYAPVGASDLQVSAKVYPTDFDPGTKCVEVSFKAGSRRYEITMQSSELEGAAREVPLEYFQETKT